MSYALNQTSKKIGREADSSGPVHTTPEKFENAALFLRLVLPSTLIRHENGAFRKQSSNRRNLKTTPSHQFVWTENNSKTEHFEKRQRHGNRDFPERVNLKWRVIVAFLNSSGVVWTENICGVLRVKPPLSNSSGV